jgi:hypothetical protein
MLRYAGRVKHFERADRLITPLASARDYRWVTDGGDRNTHPRADP